MSLEVIERIINSTPATPIGTVDVGNENKEKEETPKMWKVILHNDDSTHPYFVVEVLQEVFDVQGDKASRIMMEAHTTGHAVVGAYTRDVAESRVVKAAGFISQHGAGNHGHWVPSCQLTFTCEPEA